MIDQKWKQLLAVEYKHCYLHHQNKLDVQVSHLNNILNEIQHISCLFLPQEMTILCISVYWYQIKAFEV